jgi:hypothetical protein
MLMWGVFREMERPRPAFFAIANPPATKLCSAPAAQFFLIAMLQSKRNQLASGEDLPGVRRIPAHRMLA